LIRCGCCKGISLRDALTNTGPAQHPEIWTRYTPRILIVEDIEPYADQLARALREFDPTQPVIRFEVESTTSVAKALEHVALDDIDIYIVDLKFPLGDGQESAEIGKNLVLQIAERINAGLIVHTNVPAESEAVELLSAGADDYIQKLSRHGDYRPGYEDRPIYKMIRAKVLAVWRRVQLVRPSFSKKFAHFAKVFQIGDWQFTVGNRDLRGQSGQIVKITPTQHAFLRYLCCIEGHEINREIFNLTILGRDESEKNKRMDDFVYKIKAKLGPSVQLVSRRDTTYKLVSIQELK
jgi:DNA-binding response OmpR family regulator